MRWRVLVLLLLLIANVQLAKWKRAARPAAPASGLARSQALQQLRAKAWAEATRNNTTTYTFETTFGPPPGPGGK